MKTDIPWWQRDIFGRDKAASLDSLAPLCRQISFMLSAGVGLRSAMTVLVENPSKNKGEQISLRAVLEGIMGGDSLSDSFEGTGYFPALMCSMCRIGEISDSLPRAMELLADYYEESSRSRDEIKSILLYPILVMIMTFAMVLIAVLFVLPIYATMFEASDEPLPALTQGMLWVGDLLMTRWWLVLPAGVLLVTAPTYFFRRTVVGRGWLDCALLFVPPYRQMVNLHIVQALSLLLQSGQPLADSVLAVSGIITNKRVAHSLQQVAAGLQQGAAFWILLGGVPAIDPVVASMAKVGEETGDMGKSFEYADSYSRHRFQQLSRRLKTLIEPVMTVVVGLILALVMTAIITPAFAMTEVVGF